MTEHKMAMYYCTLHDGAHPFKESFAFRGEYFHNPCYKASKRRNPRSLENPNPDPKVLTATPTTTNTNTATTVITATAAAPTTSSTHPKIFGASSRDSRDSAALTGHSLQNPPSIAKGTWTSKRLDELSCLFGEGIPS